jgi:hypothetical protein
VEDWQLSAYEIQLYCREPSHAQKRWNICKFVGGIDGWVPDFIFAQSVPRQMMVGTRRLPGIVITETDEELPAEGRWPLRCRKCNLSMPVREGTARYDRLVSALNELARHAVSEISLSALAATVR